ncbi:hypothetical protein DID88_004996 [Monilinia fructigena]|uniref:Uncharacterized protein n=1 Tax=Monilinia fructigena TaxID=38457 RepID=A0A395IQ59_9HELO|nr:hypothetical protein DID88_004996 [Monilinia fructigena]
MATPSISKNDAVLTAYASVRINASADEVFGVITSFEKYGSGYSQYKWDDHRDKMPIVGAKGLYSFQVEEIQDLNIPVVLTLLDPAHKKWRRKRLDTPIGFWFRESPTRCID